MCLCQARPLPPRACGDTAWNAPFDTYTRPQKHRSERSLTYTLGAARTCTRMHSCPSRGSDAPWSSSPGAQRHPDDTRLGLSEQFQWLLHGVEIAYLESARDLRKKAAIVLISHTVMCGRKRLTCLYRLVVGLRDHRGSAQPDD